MAAINKLFIVLPFQLLVVLPLRLLGPLVRLLALPLRALGPLLRHPWLALATVALGAAAAAWDRRGGDDRAETARRR